MPKAIFPQLAILTLIVGVAACRIDDGSRAAVPVEVRDSAGVRIVEYEDTPSVEAPFRLSAEPRYRHGADFGDYAFQRAFLGAILPDGGAVLWDPFNSELVALSPDGASHEVLAGEGEGPGDVRMVTTVLALDRDRVLAADGALGRVTVFEGGSVERTVDVRRTQGLAVLGVGASGRLLMTTNRFSSGFDEPWLPGHMARFDMDTGALDTVASYDFISRSPPGLRFDPIGASGRVVVADGRFVQMRSDRPEITWRRPDGTVTQIVRWQAEAALLTEERLQGIEDGLREAIRLANPGAERARIDQIAEENVATYRARLGGSMPLFGIPRADAEGRIWLPAWSPAASREGASRYTVISAEGEWLGTVAALPRLRILDIAGGLVLGAQPDEMDVERVVMYELVAARSR